MQKTDMRVAAFDDLAVQLQHQTQHAVRGRVQTIAGLESLTMFWAYIAMPVGAVFSLIAIVANYLDPRRMELETAQ